MNLRESVYSIFSGLSGLYPEEYQQKYSEEMKSVFLDILEDSSGSGNWHAIRCLLREFACLPASLLREYFSFNGGGLMKSTRQVISVTVLGFISLYFILGIQSGTFIAFYNFSPEPPTGIMLLSLLIDGILFGVIVGGIIDFVLSIKNKVRMISICGLAYLAPRFLLHPEALGISIPWMNYDWQLFLLYISSPFYGICFGFLVGLAWKGWKTGIAFGLASGLMVTIAFWSNRAVAPFLMEQGMNRIVDAKILSEELWLFIFWLTSSLIYGGIVGILWGILLDRLPRMRSIGWSAGD
jgi:hypothetical protein